MMIKLYLLFLVGVTFAMPAAKNKRDGINSGKVLYDQRQEGEWNVRADLQNFVILVIPTQTSSGGGGSSPSLPTNPAGGLLDFLSKSVPKRGHLKRFQQVNKIKDEQEETQHFIESKTAPYHVDISQTRSHLAKLHPKPISAEEIVVAKSPAIELLKEEAAARGARAYVLTVPGDGEIVLSKKGYGKGRRFLKLLGAENEQCGPGLERDNEGICRVVKLE